MFMIDRNSSEPFEAPVEYFGANKELLVPGLEVTGFLNAGEVAMGKCGSSIVRVLPGGLMGGRSNGRDALS